MPETSIVVRAFNEEKHIGNLFRLIHEQEYQDFEIVLVDSGSVDKTVEIAQNNCNKILRVQSRDFTFGYSLNVGCRNSSGKYVVIISAHALPADRYWLGSLIRVLDEPNVAMVYGRHLGAPETKFSECRDFLRLFGGSRRIRKGPPFYANNANSAIKRALWEDHPFDEYLTGLEDIAWAKFFVEKGLAVVYQPDAAVYHIHEETWHQIYNRYRREAVAARQLGLLDPPHATDKLRHLCQNVIKDLGAAAPSLSPAMVKEIALFRYYQWSGARAGLRQDINVQMDRNDLYFSGVNQGVVISGRHQANFQELPMPDIKPGDVLIRVDYVGVCRTDLEIYEQQLGYYKNGTGTYPIVPGHEFCGEIAHVGANGGELQVGDRVVGECILPCDVCSMCVGGMSEACARRREVGVVHYGGAYARFLSLPARHVHKVPIDVDSRAACLTEPLAVVHKGLRRILGRTQVGFERIAVIGAGPIGNLSAQVLAAMGHEVTAFDVNATRLEYLAGKVKTRENLADLEKFDVLIEATGCKDVLKHVLDESRTGSTILLLGLPYGDLEYNFEDLVSRERVIVGSVGSSSEDFRRALDVLPKIDSSPFIGSVFPLKEFSQAWELHRSGSRLKVLLDVGRGAQL